MRFFVIFLLCFALLRPDVSAAPAQEFVVVVHKDRQLGAVTAHDVRRMFLGKISKWPDGQRVLPVYNTKDGAHKGFSRSLLNKSAAQLKTYWRKRLFSGQSMMPYMADNSAEVVAYLTEHPNAISYLPLDAVVEPLKPLSVGK
ncbi:hypothetical protein [Malonomonas rubra]|uniref:hypothetical protein n=1 Tax=Malonomonas rubra TaxID=57040 RepID=UPI0011149797|nr:hypothetical protein [Malonomonas rubra]